ncbi:coiled-coil domain-containing protein 91 isoform X13 [Podarcis muralis]
MVLLCWEKSHSRLILVKAWEDGTSTVVLKLQEGISRKMDDDDFGGFEAAENFKDGNGEPPVTSPAIPWAAFPTGDDMVTDGQPSTSTLNLADLKEQVPLSVDPSLNAPVSCLSVTEDVETASENDRKLELDEANKETLQQTLSSLEVKLKAADEEKCRIKKELEDLLEKYRILETDFLKHKEDKLISHEDQYNKLQEKHKLELEDLRRAGHEALAIIVEEFKNMLGKCMESERESNKEALAASAKIEKEELEAAIVTAVKAERENMKKLHVEEKELWQAERNKDQERIAQAIADAVEEQRQSSQSIVKAAILEEQEKSEKAIEKAVKQTREELMEYIKEQKRIDCVIRQRSLSSLELFLSCAQKQLSSLLHEESTLDAEQKKLSL